MDERSKDKFETPDDNEKATQPRQKKAKRKSPSRRTVSAVYMGMALCMVAVLALGVVSTTQDVKSGIDDLNNTDISLPDITLSIPQISQPSDNSATGNDAPVGSDVSGVNDEIKEPESSSVEEESKKPTVSYVRPVNGEVLKGYCMDSLVFSQTMQDYRTHNGVDLAAAIGTEVRAYTDGTVQSISNDPFMGTTVEILHEAGVVSVYKNLDEEIPEGISVGTEVKAGTIIGKVGQSAILEIADEPHLHFELWMNGEIIDAEYEIKDL